VLGGRAGRAVYRGRRTGRVSSGRSPRPSRPPRARDPSRIDVELQRSSIRSSRRIEWRRGRDGALDRRGAGALLHPTYDPNQLTGGVDGRLWRELNSDPRRPLLNRATAGIYPPGSTWKLATAIVGLEKGVIEPSTRMPIPCSGGMSYAGATRAAGRRRATGRWTWRAPSRTRATSTSISSGSGWGSTSSPGRERGSASPGDRDRSPPRTPAPSRPTSSGTAALRMESHPERGDEPRHRPGTELPDAAADGAVLRRARGRRHRAPAAPPRLDPQGAPRDRPQAQDGHSPRRSAPASPASWSRAAPPTCRRWNAGRCTERPAPPRTPQDPTKPHAWFTGFAGPHGQPRARPEIVIST
jgi:hypothetical protein